MTMPSPADTSFENLEELEGKSAELLPEQVYKYCKSGTESESTVKFNREAFNGLRLMPRVLVDVSNIDVSTQLLGKTLAFPLLVAPAGLQQVFHPDGEKAVARAAAKQGIPMIPSIMGSTKLQEVSEAGRGAPLMMLHLYILHDQNMTKTLIQDAEEAGYNALVVGVDAPYLGNIENGGRISPSSLPEGMEAGVLTELEKHSGKSFVKEDQRGLHIADPSLTWDFVDWLRTVTKLPVFLKGILSPADAVLAADAGVDGIIVSNQGGRQLDFAPATMDVLPLIVQALQGRTIPILVDGGVRRGTDIVKALALGAHAVLMGRPIMYGLALGGQEGVEKVLSIIKHEFKLSLALMGCPSVSQLSKKNIMSLGEPL